VSLNEETERARLDTVAADSWYDRGANAAMIRYTAEVFGRHWRPGRCLELGPAEGLMTEILRETFSDLTVVDGSEQFCRSLRQRFPEVNVLCSLFEQFKPDRQFDTIILSHVLEHVAVPNALLQLVRTWLSPHGAVYAAVPNARSVHRQAAVLMRTLPNEHSLNETDHHHGHRRVYGPESFRNEFIAAGLRIRVFGGYWLKPLSNAQIDASWTADMLEAFMQLGERYPDIAAEIYVMATA
jgi:2-polyprenyl-3-methyl-5-hydroxy-6-metoxy-1,4-benzoquinol methylase